MKLKHFDFQEGKNRLWIFPLSEEQDWFRAVGLFDDQDVTEMADWLIERGRSLECTPSAAGEGFYAEVNYPFDANAALELRVAWNCGIIAIDDEPESEPTPPEPVTYQPSASMWVIPEMPVKLPPVPDETH